MLWNANIINGFTIANDKNPPFCRGDLRESLYFVGIYAVVYVTN